MVRVSDRLQGLMGVEEADEEKEGQSGEQPQSGAEELGDYRRYE